MKTLPEESERHWYCRKSFLLKNWDDFSDENRHVLECNSICWSNLHFLGCNYPFKVLSKINEMSYGNGFLKINEKFEWKIRKPKKIAKHGRNAKICRSGSG